MPLANRQAQHFQFAARTIAGAQLSHQLVHLHTRRWVSRHRCISVGLLPVLWQNRAVMGSHDATALVGGGGARVLASITGARSRMRAKIITNSRSERSSGCEHGQQEGPTVLAGSSYRVAMRCSSLRIGSDSKTSSAARSQMLFPATTAEQVCSMPKHLPKARLQGVTVLLHESAAVSAQACRLPTMLSGLPQQQHATWRVLSSKTHDCTMLAGHLHRH